MSSSWWNLETSGWAKLVLALAALLVVGWAEWARRSQAPERDAWGGKWRPRMLSLLGVLGFAAYFNFGSFNYQDSYLHGWDAHDPAGVLDAMGGTGSIDFTTVKLEVN